MTPLRSAAISAFLLVSSSALAASGVTMSPDGACVVVQKDVGGLRWAIVRNVDDGSVVGNVFDPAGGPAQFVWCSQVSEGGGEIVFSCYGGSACTSGDCTQQWDPIGSVTLPASFFAAGGEATPTPTPKPTPQPVSCPSNGPLTNLQYDCSAYGYFYQQGNVLFALTSNGEAAATCFANDPTQILCVGGSVTSATTAELVGINLNGGPILPLDYTGTLSVSGSTLRIGVSYGGTRLDASPTWIETDPASSTESKTQDQEALARALAEAADAFVNATASPEGTNKEALKVRRALGALLGN